ncbi:FlgO family outer membrane protein [Thaumasiovibrio subtropicus]|uniref:FlgO family outer membrane protein n=1 Tax=Thaumasiovibrio subtropicus TaxID=1891207 RepID=UPI000B34DAE3|nr:FlgO family outer membrane protein [Thaumasiovibrio subtropicus]
MKNWTYRISVIVLSILVVSCSYAPIYNGKEPYTGSSFMLSETPRHTMDFFVEGLTEQLVDSNQYLTARTPLAVTSFVDLQALDETNWLGNSVSEAFMFQMQQRGYTVVDFKATGAIRVTETGDFAVSRNWEDLAGEQLVDYVLTGTMLRQGGGVLVNARIIGMRSRVVIASAQGFLPADRIGRDIDNLNKMRIENGSIIRNDVNSHDRGNVILKP